MERFLTVLEKNPRRGTALDRIYGYHVERGTIDALIEKYNARTAAHAKDAAASMIVGLLESQRGHDAAAVAAFQQAEKAESKNYLASYYLGQSLVLVGQPDAAAAAFERAIERKPPPAELLDVFQALGRVYQRAQRNEQALAVWARLEKLFPNDARVQEQIASTLAEEGEHAESLARYKKLAQNTKDRYRQSLFRMEAGELELKLGQTAQALTGFEKMLADLNPESWLYREVRRRIEEAFLRNDDQAGLAKYYAAWLGKHGDDVDAMARLAHTLAAQGRVPEAQTWLEKAIKLAPSRKELRLTFIEQLVFDQRWPDAIAQYEALDKSDPNNPDYLREWGQLILRDKSRDEAARKKAAAEVWRRLASARPKDPLAATQVADLFRHAELADEALEYYRRAIELDPESPQYREYLGEYLHTLKRSDEALATWRAIAAGKNHNAKNLTRLAEVLSGFGYLKEAVKTMGEACALENDDFARQLKYAELLGQNQQYDAALDELDQAAKLAENDEEREEVLRGQIKTFEAAETLSAEIDALAKQLEDSEKASAADWYRLARLLEAARQYTEATAAINKSLALDAKSTSALTAAARIEEAGGNLLDAANTYRKLAAIDRRERTLYLTEVAKLEARLGRRDAALTAGRDLLAAAPGNPEHYEFFAELCFQLGEGDEGLETLRRSLRANPSDPQVLLTLAKTLAERFRTDEAIELYWRAFEKSGELEPRLDIVSRLADLYLQTNQFDRLLERLERLRREAKESRELSICVAQAYHAAGDYGAAGQELARLLSQNPNDTQLLQQLSTLLESEGDVAEAAKYQQQLMHLAPSRESETRLAMLLSRAGQTEEASAIWQHLTEKEEEPERVFRAIESLIASGKNETALAITERLLREQPNSWEALYHEVALLAGDKPQEAKARCRALLDLRTDDDDLSAAAKAFKTREARKPTAGSARQSSPLAQSLSVQTRTQMAYQIRNATGLQVQPNSVNQPRTWTPGDFGQARVAALAWLLSFAEKENRQESFLAEQRTALDEAEKSKNTDRIARARWDWYYLQEVRQDNPAIFAAAKALAAGDDPLGQWVYLASLGNRVAANAQVARNNNAADNVEPLAADDLDRMLAAYRNIQKKQPELFEEAGYYGQMVLNNVTTELRRAKRTDEEQDVYHAALAKAEQPAAIASLLALAGQRGDMEGTLELLDKLGQQPAGRGGSGAAQYYVNNVASSLCSLMSERADDKQHADILRLYDRYWEYSLRQRRSSARPGTRRRSTSAQQSNYYQLVLGKNKRKGMQMSFPMPNDYFDFGGILLLREAYELYNRDDLLSDLVTHLQTGAAKAPPAEGIYAQLALAYLHSWEESPRAAIDDFSRACELAPDDLNLKLDLAELRETNGDLEDALTLADSISPLDQSAMQRRELLALRVAVRSGNIERARQAAERLFGLRLDAEMQIELAAQMRQLGMHELAEAVLGRAHRQAGNRGAALVALMLQYQAQNKPDIAAQVAHQILRRVPSRQRSPNMGQTTDDAARSQAIAVLARGGKLKEMIERAEAQLKNAAHSVEIAQTLAEYYQAAGDRQKSVEMYQQMAAARPDDARLQYQVAQQLSQLGDAAAAVEHYRAAIKKEPRLFASSYRQVEQTFRQAKKEDELVKLLEEIDLKTIGNYSTVTNLISNMMRIDAQRPQAMKLFKMAWEAFPTQRSQLVSRIYDDKFWSTPEAFDFARQALIPSGEVAPADPWSGITSLMSFSGDGRVNSLITRFLDGAANRNQLEPLAAEVEGGVKRFPQWLGGKLLLALIQVRRGQAAAARAAIEALLADRASPPPTYACWVAGQELENRGELNDLALKFYENTVDQNDIQLDFSYSPLKRLVGIYHKAGRDEDARAMVLKLAKGRDYSNYDPGYAAYQRIESNVSIGQQLIELGYAADAAKMYNELLGDPESFEQAEVWNNGMGNRLKQQTEQGMAKALEGIKPEGARSAIDTFLQPARDTGGDAPALDLVLLVQPRDLSRAELTSMLAGVLKSAASAAEAQNAAAARLKQMTSDYPADLSVQIAAALISFAGGKEGEMASAVNRLLKLADETPLEELPAGGRPNSRQRTEAAHQIGLWLVARECAKKDSLREASEKLAERALQAARRQLDPIFALAMLRERGQAALDRGDRAQAERFWSEMLELVLPKPAEKKAADKAAFHKAQRHPVEQASRLFTSGETLASRTHSVEQASRLFASPQRRASGTLTLRASAVAVLLFIEAASAPAEPAAAPAKPPGLPAPTLAQFDQAMEVAVLAAEHDLHELSLRAVRDALRPGPPALPMKAMHRNSARAVVRSARTNQADGDQTQIAQRVEQRISRLSALWKSHSAPPEAVYETLAAAVFPAGRPGEILLYAPPLTVSSLANPTSAGTALIEWTVRAGCADRLRKEIAGRLEQPLAQLPGHVLLAQLALTTGDRKAAGVSLAWLSQRLEGETLQSSAEMACHAALPALNDAALAPEAVSIVERAAKNLSTQANQNSNDEPAASLLLLLARHQLRHGAAEAGRKTLDDYLAVCQQMNVRYSGDYGIYRRKQQLAKGATELATAGLADGALVMLGQYADTQIGSNNGLIDTSAAALTLFQQLGELPAAERYEKLKQWSLPTKDRNSVRLLAAFVPRDDLPEAFRNGGWASRPVTSNGDGPGGPSSNASGDLVSTLALLVEAAQAAGQLDELAKIAHKAAHNPDQKIENAAALRLLVELARRRPENARPTANTIATELAKRVPAQDDRSLPMPWADYIVANACANNGALADVGDKMLDSLRAYCQRAKNWPLLSHVRIDVAALAVRRIGQPRRDVIDRLIPWQPAVHSDTHTHSTGAARTWWLADGRQVVHAGGASSDHLIFNWPLTGTFEIAADLLDGGWAEGNIGYAGLCIEAYRVAKYVNIFPVGRHEQVQRTLSGMRPANFNRYTIRVQPGQAVFLINGREIYREADASPAACWLDLFTSRERRTAFRNVRITGKPIVPREVELVLGDRLDGWLSGYYSESQPARLYKTGSSDASKGYFRFTDAVGPDDYDWRAEGGVIHGRRVPGIAAETSQSRLHFMRPLGDGETLRYEFLYKPDAMHVHPAVDRLVFLIEPDGVALHWMTDGELDSSRLPPDNVAAEPANRRGPPRLPLKAGEWNAVELHLEKGVLSLTLNGTQVYQRPLEATNDRLFSLFHFKDRSEVRVRNIVLSGDDWPAELNDTRMANLLLPDRHEAEIDPNHLAEAVLGEETVCLSTWEVWQTAHRLSAAERYAYLRDWVLPGGPQGTIVRLYGDFTPSDAAPPAHGSSDAPRRSGRSPQATAPPSRSAGATLPPPASTRTLLTADDGSSDAPRRSGRSPQATAPPSRSAGATLPPASGGELVVPAIDLVAVAKQLGKLDELRSLVKARTASDAFSRRGQAAMLVLIGVANENDEQARPWLESLYREVKGAGKDPEHRSWPLLMAAWAAVERPALQPVALRMLELIAGTSHQVSTRWQLTTKRLLARAVALSMRDGPAVDGNPWPLRQWQTASHATAASRGEGQPPAVWLHQPGGLAHSMGHNHDYVYFAVPLRGDFEVEAQLSTFDWREVSVAYAATSLTLHHTRRKAMLTNFERPRGEAPIAPPLEELGRWYRHRLSVRAGNCEVYVDGRKIFDQRLPAEPDPWLAFHASAAHLSQVRSVRITGTPTVPTELHLSAASNLDSWLAEYYGESVSGEEPSWAKRGDEIFGRKLAGGDGVWESVLQYHRPLFEDGEIRYEFYYQPGQAAVAPALDRLAFLLEPSGVEIHWLSDAQYDRTGLSAANRAPEEENRVGPVPLPLKKKDWNQVRLALAGDTVTLHLNGVEIYRRKLEPTNQRVFGFYHDAAQSEARVRNVVYQGDWPKSLSPLGEQELAVSPAVRAALDERKLAASFHCDLRAGQPLPKQLDVLPQAADKYITLGGTGARIVLPVGEEKPNAVGYQSQFRLHGDFEVVAIYSGLKTVCAPQIGGAGIDLEVSLDDGLRTELMLQRRRRHDGVQVMHSTMMYDLPGKLDRPLLVAMTRSAADAGKLKLVRKGPTVYYLFAKRDSDNYELLHECQAGEADARVQLLARTFTKQCATDVVLEELSMRAEAFVAPGSERASLGLQQRGSSVGNALRGVLRAARERLPTPAGTPQRALPPDSSAGRSILITIVASLAIFVDVASAPAKPPALPVATLAQFDQAMEVAVLAAEHDLHELSLRAVRDALTPGPPAVPMKAMQRNLARAVVRSVRTNEPDGDQSQIAQRVEQRISRLSVLWKSHSAPPEAVYETLAAAVLPAGRPGEILLYAPSLTVGSLASPTSAGKALVEWTVRAGCADRLRKEIAVRLEQPLAQLPGHVLLAQLALASGDRKAAAESLAWLSQRLEGETLQSSAEIACHAALPALNHAELAPQAVSIVERAANNLSAQANQNSNDEPAASLLLLLARHQLRQGAAEAGRKSLDDYLAVCQQMNVRYSGDYGIHRRKQQLAKVAAELAAAGQVDPALDMLAQFADTQVASRYGQADEGLSLVALFQQLAALPVAERYEKLKQWSLPTKDRKSVRMLAAFVPRDDLPEVFRNGGWASRPVTSNGDGPGGQSSNASGDLVSTLALLVDAAQAAGQLDELAKIAHEAPHDTQQKIENAAALEVLVGLARRRPENVREAATALAAELAARKPAQAWTLSGLPGADYLVANACALNAALSDVGLGMLQTLLHHSQQSQNHPLLSHLRIDVAQQAARRLGRRRRDDVGQIIPWQPAVFMSAAMHRAGAARPWWAVDGRQAVHVGGAETDHLIFSYPLTGTFEITADLLDGAWAEANLGYGGVCFAAYTHGKEAHIFPVSHHEQILRPLFGRRGDSFRRHTIQVAPGSVQFLVDGHLAYREADPGTAAPWLDFFTSRERRTAFQNVRITGQPIIPRQVELVKGDRLDGWLTNFYNESQPARLYKGKPNDNSGGYYRFGNRSSDDYDWRAADGVIRGGRAPGLPAGSQSRLCYMRPLGDGETLRYEFLYEPGATHVSPVLDRLVFLIEPEGVALHWMTDGENDSPQLPPDNVAVEQDHRRGPKRLPLKAGEWNAMQLRLEKGEVVLTLNGTEIYRRPLETTNDRLFSFFHFKDRTAVEVRNVVLSGDGWPRELNAARLANLLAPIKSDEDVDPAGLTEALLGEENVFLTTWQVWQASRALASAERYSYLRDWVLPGGIHGSVVRLYGDFTPTDPAPPVPSSSDAPRRSRRSPKATDSASRSAAATALPPTSGRTLLPAARRTPADSLEGRPTQSGGDVVVPALDLVAVAAEIGKLDELRLLAEARLASDELAAEAKTALLVLIALAEGDDERSRQALQVLYPATKNVKKESPEYRRWPALVAAWAACARPALRPIALTMLNKLADGSQGSGARWERTVRHLRARASLAAMPDGNIAFGAPLPLKQWQAAAHGTAATRGGEHPRLHWQHRPGSLTHYTGHEFGYAYFAVPMRGNFEIEAELSTFGFREITAAYSASVFGLVYDRKNYTQWNLERKQPNGAIFPPLDELGQWYRYRLMVKDGEATTFVNGRRIASHRLPDEQDPWFAFRSWELFNAEARQVRITGTPQVPEELRLSAAANLDAWLAEYYGESVSGDNANWQKRGEEIFGHKRADAGDATWQSLLQYHRPLFEDGQIDYEFFYQPGEATVSPALDRLALLLEPSGVDVHWLTDAQYDRTNVSADNRTTENGNRRGPPKLPLKEDDWNQVRLTLQGANVRVQLNGTEVYQRDLEPTNQRVFGLYHDAANSEARVRNVLYRGDWPKKLPPLAEQELAVSPATRAAFNAQQLPAKFEFDFRGNQSLPPDLLHVPRGAEKFIKRSASGARIILPAGQEKPTAVGFETAFRLHGDFELIATFSGLKPTPEAKSWAPGIDLHLYFDAPSSSDAMLERRQRFDGTNFVQTTWAYDLPDKLDRITTNHVDPVAATAGKLKIARKGPMLYYLIAERGSDDYRLLSEHVASDADAVRAQVYARSFSKDSGVDVVLEAVSIRAEAFLPATSSKRP